MSTPKKKPMTAAELVMSISRKTFEVEVAGINFIFNEFGGNDLETVFKLLPKSALDEDAKTDMADNATSMLKLVEHTLRTNLVEPVLKPEEIEHILNNWPAPYRMAFVQPIVEQLENLDGSGKN